MEVGEATSRPGRLGRKGAFATQEFPCRRQMSVVASPRTESGDPATWNGNVIVDTCTTGVALETVDEVVAVAERETWQHS